MNDLLETIGIAALFAVALWPALTSPSNVERHLADQCRQKKLYVALNACERVRLNQTKETL